MIPEKSDPRWEALVRGEIKPNFKVFSGNMMLNQLSRSIQRDGTDDHIQVCVDQAYSYFERFEMLFVDELNEIFR